MKSIFALTLICFLGQADFCFPLPTKVDTAISVDAYTDMDAEAFLLYWCKPQGVNPCADLDFVDAKSMAVGIPTPDPITGRHNVTILAAIPTVKVRMCFRMTARDAAGNESEFSTIASDSDGCGWFGMPNPKNMKLSK